jgi:predicted PurR-regulated permease PerM
MAMKETNTGPNIYDTSIRLLFLALIMGWCLMILVPFTSIMLWGFILGIAFSPLHSKLAKMMGGESRSVLFNHGAGLPGHFYYPGLVFPGFPDR